MQTFPTPSLKGRAASSLCIQNPSTPPPHTLYSEAAATFPYSWLITEKICSPRRKATLSDKRQATAQPSARKGIQAVPREHAASSGHCRHRGSCSRSLYSPNFGSFSYPKVQPHQLVTFCRPQGSSSNFTF